MQALNAAYNGIQLQMQRLNAAAAQALRDANTETTPTEGEQNGSEAATVTGLEVPDLVTDFVNLTETRQAFTANIETVKLLNRTLGRVLDLKA